MHRRSLAAALLLGVIPVAANAQAKNPLKHAPQPTSAAITAGDLMTRLYIFADDSMMGRAAGTINNNRGTDYIASELKKLGIQPGGDNGTYFQQLPLASLNVSTTKPLAVGDLKFYGMKDFIPRLPHGFNGEQIVYGGTYGSEDMISATEATGKIVLLSTPVGPDGKPTWNNMRQPVQGRYARTANAVWLVGMSGMSATDMIPLRESGITFIPDSLKPEVMSSNFGFGYVTNEMAQAMMGAPLAGMKAGTLGKTLSGFASFDTVVAPARNVIGIIPGSDPKLKGQYVALGGHNDHIGFQQGAVDHDSVRAFNMVARPEGAEEPAPTTLSAEQASAFRRVLDSLRKDHPARKDSIYNGADDDGSGSMANLEIAEFFAKSPAKPKRSLLFVWHTGEELGLLGSEYFTDHPTVPRDSIVAQLNMDMIGRGDAGDVTGHVMSLVAGQPTEGPAIHGNPDYLQLVGSRRLSTELGDIIEKVNNSEARPLKLDYSIDANGHPANIYCRSDHYEYARYGIPITFFTTGGHADYHQLTDEPQYIDYDHYARVTNFVKDIAVAVANLDHRVVVDKPKPDPNGMCRQ